MFQTQEEMKSSSGQTVKELETKMAAMQQQVLLLVSYLSHKVRKPTMWILTRSDTNQAV